MNKIQKSGLLLRSGILVLALVAAGCQSSQSHQGPPDGEYRRGGLLLILDQGRFSLSVSDPSVDKVEEGSYTIDEDSITFNVENVTALARFCKNNPTYIYQWSFDAEVGQLTFKAVDDSCLFRSNNYTMKPLVYGKLQN